MSEVRQHCNSLHWKAERLSKSITSGSGPAATLVAFNSLPSVHPLMKSRRCLQIKILFSRSSAPIYNNTTIPLRLPPWESRRDGLSPIKVAAPAPSGYSELCRCSGSLAPSQGQEPVFAQLSMPIILQPCSRLDVVATVNSTHSRFSYCKINYRSHAPPPPKSIATPMNFFCKMNLRTP